MKFRISIIATAAAAALVMATGVAVTGASGAPVAQSAVRHFEGKVVSKSSTNRAFRVKDLERGTVRIKVKRTTRFERIAGFAGVRRGATVEVIAKRSGGVWVAISVHRPGGGGRHGGGQDDGPNHT